MANAPYFRLFVEDFLEGCRKSCMTPEEIGAYIVMLCLEWSDQEPLKDDFRVLSSRTGWDPRLVKRLVGQLVERGKYLREEGRLRNARMQDEIAKFCADRRRNRGDVRPPINRSTDEKTEHLTKPNISETSPRCSGELRENAPESSTISTGRSSKFRHNQNQNQKREVSRDARVEVHAAKTGSAQPTPEVHPHPGDPSLPTPLPPAPPSVDQFGRDATGFVARMAKAYSTLAPNWEFATRQLIQLGEQFGVEAVKDAIGDYDRAAYNGKVTKRTWQGFYAYCVQSARKIAMQPPPSPEEIAAREEAERVYRDNQAYFAEIHAEHDRKNAEEAKRRRAWDEAERKRMAKQREEVS